MNAQAGNVIALAIPHRRQTMADRAETLTRVFAGHRRSSDDVFWLKENAEHLNILECTGQTVGPEALAAHAEFYRDLPQRLSFFPQYYRFLLSIALDLEDLGMDCDLAEGLCDWAARSGLPEAELSDLQRAEARRLLARRGVQTPAADPGLDDRLRDFVSRTGTFALPNKKAAYELTHIAFYLSEYGRRDPELPSAALESLEYAGLLAFLEQNMDLLAEVCVALRYAGQVPSPVWEARVLTSLRDFCVVDDRFGPLHDDYHEFLVSSWLAGTVGADGISAAIPEDRCRFDRRAQAPGPLRDISTGLFQMNAARSDDWTRMQPLIEGLVDDYGQHVLAEAAASSDRFDAFFARFARAGAAG